MPRHQRAPNVFGAVADLSRLLLCQRLQICWDAPSAVTRRRRKTPSGSIRRTFSKIRVRNSSGEHGAARLVHHGTRRHRAPLPRAPATTSIPRAELGRRSGPPATRQGQAIPKPCSNSPPRRLPDGFTYEWTTTRLPADAGRAILLRPFLPSCWLAVMFVFLVLGRSI